MICGDLSLCRRLLHTLNTDYNPGVTGKRLPEKKKTHSVFRDFPLHGQKTKTKTKQQKKKKKTKTKQNKTKQNKTKQKKT